VRKLSLFINVSLDGYADHTVAIADDELHDFASDFLKGMDLMLFGRVTYELMESYWPRAHTDPTATQSVIAFADRFNRLPRVVFSRTLTTVGPNARLVSNDMVGEVKRLKQQSGKNMSVGGISVAQELMRHGLIDDYWLLVQPLGCGKGRRLFDGLDETIQLTLAGTRTFGSGVVVMHYV
jgi:dihydrofolate reductase